MGVVEWLLSGVAVERGVVKEWHNVPSYICVHIAHIESCHMQRHTYTWMN